MGGAPPEYLATPPRISPGADRPVSSELRLHLDGLDRYHGSGALIMAAGSAGMLISLSTAPGPPWAGFLAGALPTFLLASLVHAVYG